MSVTAQEVNKLRKQTGAGLMDCKKALEESSGDFDAAVDYLRKKGQKISEKRADREATEGAVISLTNKDKDKGVLVHVSCETDFVAKNENFVQFAQNIAEAALNEFPHNTDALLQLKTNGTTVEQNINEQVGKIGEKIEVANYETLEGETVISYIHAGNKIGVLVAFNQSGDKVESIGRDIAMQIAAMNPVAINKDDVDEAVQKRELEIAREQIRAEGKPEKLVDQIAQGKLNKFFKENTLLHQQYVKDSSKTIKQVLQEVDKDLKVTGFKRAMIGS